MAFYFLHAFKSYEITSGFFSFLLQAKNAEIKDKVVNIINLKCCSLINDDNELFWANNWKALDDNNNSEFCLLILFLKCSFKKKKNVDDSPYKERWQKFFFSKISSHEKVKKLSKMSKKSKIPRPKTFLLFFHTNALFKTTI
jgi:hypothetical protein